MPKIIIDLPDETYKKIEIHCHRKDIRLQDYFKNMIDQLIQPTKHQEKPTEKAPENDSGFTKGETMPKRKPKKNVD